MSSNKTNSTSTHAPGLSSSGFSTSTSALKICIPTGRVDNVCSSDTDVRGARRPNAASAEAADNRPLPAPRSTSPISRRLTGRRPQFRLADFVLTQLCRTITLTFVPDCTLCRSALTNCRWLENVKMTAEAHLVPIEPTSLNAGMCLPDGYGRMHQHCSCLQIACRSCPADGRRVADERADRHTDCNCCALKPGVHEIPRWCQRRTFFKPIRRRVATAEQARQFPMLQQSGSTGTNQKHQNQKCALQDRPHIKCGSGCQLQSAAESDFRLRPFLAYSISAVSVHGWPASQLGMMSASAIVMHTANRTQLLQPRFCIRVKAVQPVRLMLNIVQNTAGPLQYTARRYLPD